MKYTIQINQKAVMDNDFDLDIIDVAIFQLLKDFSHSKQCKKFIVGNEAYYVFSWKLVVNQLPILKITSKSPIQKRYNKLIEAGLLERCPENESMGQPLYRFGENYDAMEFGEVKKFSHTVSNETPPHVPNDMVPVSQKTWNNNIDDNTIEDKLSKKEKIYKKRN